MRAATMKSLTVRPAAEGVCSSTLTWLGASKSTVAGAPSTAALILATSSWPQASSLTFQMHSRRMPWSASSRRRQPTTLWRRRRASAASTGAGLGSRGRRASERTERVGMRIWWRVSTLPSTFSPNLLSISSGKGSRAPKSPSRSAMATTKLFCERCCLRQAPTPTPS
uniref:Uncharacterized protein n=1 Tax=Oryza brachyantha TaxID=4533 RepID=J3LIY2_ORYBR